MFLGVVCTRPGMLLQEKDSEPDDIIPRLRLYLDVVKAHLGDKLYGTRPLQAGVGILCTFLLGVSDSSTYETAVMVYLIERGDHVRSQGSRPRMHNKLGSWHQYRGVVQQGTLSRVNLYMLHREAISRALPQLSNAGVMRA